MSETPTSFQDFNTLVSKEGVKTEGTWYHGTSSGLISSIQKQGLKGSGDQALNKRTAQTMNAIAENSGGVAGSTETEFQEPVFLTQSKEIAYFWAAQKTHSRNVYFNNNETPVLFEVALPEDKADQVKPDVGGAAMLIGPANDYINFLKKKYDENGIDFDQLNPSPTDRMAYINFLGMAYSTKDIDADYVKVLEAE